MRSLLRRLAILQDPRYYSIVDDYNRLCSQLQSFTEVNECALRPDICGDGKCIDTKEGYECECYPGFTRKPGGRCEDVDECLLGYCQGGICHNQPGSFTCDCPHGFVVSGDGRYCTGNRLLFLNEGTAGFLILHDINIFLQITMNAKTPECAPMDIAST